MPKHAHSKKVARKVATTKQALAKPSIGVKRYFTKAGKHPFDLVKWVKRDATVGGGKVFEQKGVEFPEFWSSNAVNITASKYFRGTIGSPKREASAKSMISRVTKTIRGWGEEAGYFSGAAEAQTFEDELTHILLHQKGSFNSPVWFNVGSEPHPQCSACFILSVEDDMRSILDWIRNEGMIFKYGSGAGISLSPLRSKREPLSKGGYASGPVSFMRGADSVAGMIKSGGATRRAAKMVVLGIDHPDVMEFIRSKAEEEKKIHALMDAGYNMSDLNNDAWNSIQFQNANNSVRITDDFMKAVEKGGEWQTSWRADGPRGEKAPSYPANELLRAIAQAAWECGDPGVQFDTTINRWHTCPNSGRINASNPCSEYMHLDNSACNLASINLMKFVRKDGTFMVDDFRHTVQTFILAQDILVGGSSYPTEKIGENARAFRELGLGFANLGALLMTKGIAYDSADGFAWGGAIASLMAGEAYRMSTVIASRVGPFAGYAVNKAPMLDVIRRHGLEAKKINTKLLKDRELASAAQSVWSEALVSGKKYGVRNSQATVIAPTGTISFMMDCDTTGIEPDFSLVKMKQLVGGGWMKIINASVPAALANLGYAPKEAKVIVDYITEKGTIEGAPGFKEKDLSVFDCAVKPAGGNRSISWRGHVGMVAAVQPFISGAISKTFNMPNETTVEEIEEAYIEAWKKGIKAFAVYRDGSKATQPLSTAAQKKKPELAKQEAALMVTTGASRRRLPRTRVSETHKFTIAGHEGYLTYSAYDDGGLSEIFIRMAKQGSTLSGLLDSFAISVSMALQYGVPVKDLCQKFIYARFEPAGFTENPDIQIATSIVDYIFRYLALRFLSSDDLADFGMERTVSAAPMTTHTAPVPTDVPQAKADPEPVSHASTGGVATEKKTVTAGTVCKKCGGMMVRTGTCSTCLQCGDSSGGCS